MDFGDYKGVKKKYHGLKVKDLKRYDEDRIDDFYVTSCVYILYDDDEIVYIGQTHDLGNRFDEGHKMDGQFDSFSFIKFKGALSDDPDEWEKRTEQREELEYDLIEKYRPAENIEGNPDYEDDDDNY